MSNSLDRLAQLLEQLQFTIAGDDRAVGTIRDLPTTLIAIGTDPPTFLFHFRANPAGVSSPPPLNLPPDLPPNALEVAHADGTAWLTLHNALLYDNDQIVQFVNAVGSALQETPLAVGPGCLRCNSSAPIDLMLVEGRATRVCEPCLAAAEQERQESEAQLNRTSLRATLAVPGTALIAAAAWALFWTVLDLFLDWLRITVVPLDNVTIPLLVIFFAAAGAGMGWPAGNTLRRSIGARSAPRVVSIVFVITVALAGEVLYVALYLLRMAGLFDLQLATLLLGQVWANYTKFWIACKVGLAIAAAFACALATAQRQQASLRA